jgi:rapamycin-insensitive companion of mTOR
MSKTELGCQVLQEKGHFNDFAHFVKQHGLESEDIDLIMKLKSILWTVVSSRLDDASTILTPFQGNVGATEGGLPFLEDEMIPTILEIAEHSPIPSVRGYVASRLITV